MGQSKWLPPYVAFDPTPNICFFSFIIVFFVSELFELSKKLQKIYCTHHPLESLCDTARGAKIGKDFYLEKNPLQPVKFEIFDQHIETKRMHHPFRTIKDHFWEEVDEDKRLEAILKKNDELSIVFVAASEGEEKAFKEKIDQTLLPLPTG